MLPVRMTRSALETILLDMAERVHVGDSLEGFIEYAIPYEDSDADEPDISMSSDGVVYTAEALILLEQVDVTARYRIGNLDHGQGFMRIIGTIAP
jgi:hypothetical protein